MKTCERCREEYRFLAPAVTAIAYSAEAGSDPRERRDCGESAAEGTAHETGAGGGCVLARAARVGGLRRGGGRDCDRDPHRSARTLSLSRQLDRERAQRANEAQIVADLTAPESQHHRFTRGDVLTNGNRLYLTMHGLPKPAPGPTSTRRGRSRRARSGWRHR